MVLFCYTIISYQKLVFDFPRRESPSNPPKGQDKDATLIEMQNVGNTISQSSATDVTPRETKEKIT